MTKEKILKIKKEIDKRRPNFTRTDAGQKKKINFKWRKPKGIHNKMRHQKRGWKVLVKVGYRSPSLVRDHDGEGKKIILISNISQLKKIDKKNETIIIANIGTKKKIEIAKEANKSGITINNIRDVEKYIQTIEEEFSKKKEAQKEKKDKRSEKKKELEKKKEKETKKKEKAEETTQNEEEQKKKEKKEKDLALIHGN